MLKVIRWRYRAHMPRPSPHVISNQNTYYLEHECKVSWVFVHPKSLKHADKMKIYAWNPKWLISCQAKIFQKMCYVQNDESNDPTEFFEHQSNMALCLGVLWSLLACLSPITTELCNFLQLWHVYQFPWIFRHFKPFQDADWWQRIMIIFSKWLDSPNFQCQRLLGPKKTPLKLCHMTALDSQWGYVNNKHLLHMGWYTFGR